MKSDIVTRCARPGCTFETAHGQFCSVECASRTGERTYAPASGPGPAIVVRGIIHPDELPAGYVQVQP